MNQHFHCLVILSSVVICTENGQQRFMPHHSFSCHQTWKTALLHHWGLPNLHKGHGNKIPSANMFSWPYKGGFKDIEVLPFTVMVRFRDFSFFLNIYLLINRTAHVQLLVAFSYCKLAKEKIATTKLTIIIISVNNLYISNRYKEGRHIGHKAEPDYASLSL